MKPIKLTESDFNLDDNDLIIYECEKNGLKIQIIMANYGASAKVLSRDDWYGNVIIDIIIKKETSLAEIIEEINKEIQALHTALSATQEPCEYCNKENPHCQINYKDGEWTVDLGYGVYKKIYHCLNCGRELEEV